MITQDNAAEICAVHNSCDGTDGDCRTARGTRPVSYDAGLELFDHGSGYDVRPGPCGGRSSRCDHLSTGPDDAGDIQ